MFQRRGIIPFIIIAFFALSSFTPQDQEWTGFLGRPFDSVVAELQSKYAYCDTHHISKPKPAVIASCVPFEFIGEKGLLVLRRSATGNTVKSCSWIRGEHPSFRIFFDRIDSLSRSELALKVGDLDRIFNAVWSYYELKAGAGYTATEDGSYLWKPEHIKNKNIEYTMSRSATHMEFSVTINEGSKTKSKLKKQAITGK